MPAEQHLRRWLVSTAFSPAAVQWSVGALRMWKLARAAGLLAGGGLLGGFGGTETKGIRGIRGIQWGSLANAIHSRLRRYGDACFWPAVRRN